jgi:ABC-type multidrug transport system fused ATPase/permease subunit
MIFFMTENLGPLTGVFTRDLGVVSEERMFVCSFAFLFFEVSRYVSVADAIQMALIYLLIVLTTMVLISIQFIAIGSPYLAVACVVLIIISAVIQFQYAGKVKACKSDFQQANDDLFHHLSDSLEGVKVLRSAEKIAWSIEILADSFKQSRVCTVASEECTLWLMRRADAMGVVLSFLACILSIVQGLGASPRGLAISNSLQILVFYSWTMRNLAAAIYSSGSVDRVYDYISAIPREHRAGAAVGRYWPESGDVEVC